MPPRVGHVCIGLILTALLCAFQFVAHLASSYGAPNGRPEFHRIMPVICQPPIKAFLSAFESEKYLWPWPNGRAQMVLMLIMCRVSKSESAYESFCLIGLSIKLSPYPPVLVELCKPEESSIE